MEDYDSAQVMEMALFILFLTDVSKVQQFVLLKSMLCSCTFFLHAKLYTLFLFSVIPQPLANWPLNHEHGLNDISGHDLHLELMAGTVNTSTDPVTDQEFIYVDGTFQARVNHAGALQLTGDYTVFVAVSSLHLGYVFGYGGTATNYREISMYMHDSLSHFYWHCWPVCTHGVLQNNFFNKGVWNYVAVTFDSTNGKLKLFKNGQHFETFDVTADLSTGTDDGYLYIGKHGSEAAGFFHTPELYGRLACLQIYDQALSTGQIQKLILDCKARDPMESKSSE